LCELVPPPFLDPSLLLLLILLLLEARFDIFHFSQTNRPIEIKDVEKRVIVEDVDGCIMRSVTSLIFRGRRKQEKKGAYPTCWDSRVGRPWLTTSAT
jgi:hypothetical protein